VSLNNVRFQQLPPNRRGNSRRYPVGTVVRVNHPQKAAYFVAIADINEHGVASGSLDSVKDALASLWTYVGTRGLKEPLLIPVLGTGFTRLPESRELIIREIIKSFVAACADKVFSDKLTIVIHPKDLANHQIAFDMLASYLKHICTYTEFPPIATPRTGIPEDQPVPLLGTPPAQMPNAAT